MEGERTDFAEEREMNPLRHSLCWCALVVAGAAILGVAAVSAEASLIYIVDGHSHFFGFSSRITTFDSETKAEMVLNGSTWSLLTDIAVSPSGNRLYAVGKGLLSANKYLYRYNPTTGAYMAKWDLGTGQFNNALVAESETSLLLMAKDSSGLWRVHLQDDGDYDHTQPLGDAGFYAEGDLAFGLDGTLYAVGQPKDGEGPNSQLYTISLSGGVSWARIGDMGHENFFGLAVDQEGTLYAGRGHPGDGEKIYVVNTLTGETTIPYDASLPEGIYGMASTVPEPVTLGLLLVVGLGVLGRRPTSAGSRQ